VHGDTAELLAVKSETEEETLDQAKASLNHKDRDRALVFIQERVTPRAAESRSTLFDIGREATYRDLDFVLGRMPMIHTWDEQRRLTRPPSIRSGFLVALTELMSTGVNAWASSEGRFHVVRAHR